MLELPLIKMLRGSDRESLRGDLTAGLTTAVMLVPQGMAYAMLAGLEPIVGLYASTLPTAIYALLGTSRSLAVGPVAMVSLLVAAGVAPLAGDDPVLYAAYASLLMLMVGVMQAGMGFARLGFLVKYLSHPVIAGFTSAAALIIGSSQLKHVLGLDIPRSHHVHAIVASALAQVGDVHLVTLAIALASVAALVILKKAAPRFPRFLLVVAAGGLAVWGLGLDDAGVAIVGAVPSGLPSPALPSISGQALAGLLPTALAIALVGFMESIAVAKAFARKGGYAVDANQELRALGLANVGGAFFQGYPVTGGFSRTAVNAQAGARTPLAGLITAVAVAASLLLLTPLFFYLPKAVLAAIILTAVLGLVDVAEARHLWSSSKPDFALMALTFAATLVLGIEQGIGLGVAASLVWFVLSNSKPNIAVLGRVPGQRTFRDVRRRPEAQALDGVVAVRVDAPLFFANAASLQDAVRDLVLPDTRAVILDASAIGSIDSSGADALSELAASLRDDGVELWLSTVRGPVRDALDHSSLGQAIPPERVVEQVWDAWVALAPAAPSSPEPPSILAAS